MRLIDADALKKKAVLVNTDEECYSYILFEDVMDAPTIEERKTGKWITDGCLDKCSCCGVSRDDQLYDNYCGNCGAKMEGAEK